MTFDQNYFGMHQSAVEYAADVIKRKEVFYMGEKLVETAANTAVVVIIGAILGTIIGGPGAGTAAGAKIAACCCGAA